MKKVICLIMLLVSLCANAQQNFDFLKLKDGFGYEPPFFVQLGRSHAIIQQPFKETFYGNKAQSEFDMIEGHALFMYFATDLDGGFRTSGHSVLGGPWDINYGTFYWRYGLCVGGIHWVGNHFLTTQSLTLTFIATEYYTKAGDSSNNTIGWTSEDYNQQTNFTNYRNDYGIKLDYMIGPLGIALINTFYETTISFNVNFGMKDIIFFGKKFNW